MSAVSAKTDAADLRARRQRLGLSQQALAQLACCSLSAVRLFEAGYSPRESAVRDRIQAVLDESAREGAL